MITCPAGAIDERFNNTIYMVQATHFERLRLWQEFTKYDTPAYPAVDWKDDSGIILTLGEVAGRPIACEFMFLKINGQRICWYEGSGSLVDYSMIDQWLEHHTVNKAALFRIPQSNAQNFYNVMMSVNLKNGIKL